MEAVEDFASGGDVDGNRDGLEGLEAGPGCSPGGEVAMVRCVLVVPAAEVPIQLIKEGDSLRGEAAKHFVGDEDDAVPRTHMRSVAGLVGAGGGWSGGKGSSVGMGVDHRLAMRSEDGGEDLHLKLDVAGRPLGAGTVGTEEGDVGVLGAVRGGELEAAKVGSAAKAAAGKGRPAVGGGVVAAVMGRKGVLGDVAERVHSEGAAPRGDSVDVTEAGEGKPEAALGGHQHGIAGNAVGLDGRNRHPEVVGMGGGGGDEPASLTVG